MKVTDLLANNGYILCNKYLAREIGLNEAIILGELVAEYNYWEQNSGLEDGWFYSTIENVEEATTLSGRQQRPAMTHLEELGIIKIEKRGIPCKRYIFIDVTKLSNKLLQNVTTGSYKMSQQEVTKCHTNNNKKSNKNNNKKIYIPTLDEVKDYIKEKDLNVDANFFYEYFTEGNWVDSKGNPVRNWKQKLLTWNRQNANQTKSKSIKKPSNDYAELSEAERAFFGV